MKAEHRLKADHGHKHREELRTNVLADRMGRFMQTVRQRPKGRTLLIWVAVIVVVIGLIFWLLASRTRTVQQSELWKILYQGEVSSLAFDPAYADGKQALIAQLEHSWSMLWDFTGKTEKGDVVYGGIVWLKSFSSAHPYLPIEQAESGPYGYQKLLDKIGDDPILAPEALYNLAVAQEALAAKDIKKLDAARATFEKLVKDFPDSARAKLADQRLSEVYRDEDRFTELRGFYLDLGKQLERPGLPKDFHP